MNIKGLFRDILVNLSHRLNAELQIKNSIKTIFSVSVLLAMIITLSGCKETVEDIVTGLKEISSYSVAYKEKTGSGSELKFSEIAGDSVLTTRTIIPAPANGPFDLSDDGRKLAYVSENTNNEYRIEIYDTQTGNNIKTYTAFSIEVSNQSDVAKMLRNVSGKSNYAILSVLGIDWTSQNNDLLGVHLQITLANAREAYGAYAFTLNTVSHKGVNEIKPLSGQRSQSGFGAFDWSPNDNSIVFDSDVGSKEVSLSKINSVTPSKTISNAEMAEWGKSGVAFVENDDIYIFDKGNNIRITSTNDVESNVNMAAAGNSKNNDMVSWLNNGSIYYLITDGTSYLPTGVPYQSRSDPFEVPLSGNILAFDIATKNYAP